MLTERLGVDPPEAFNRLRSHARATNRKLADLARDVLTGRASLPADDPPQQPDAAARYAHRARQSAQAAARDAQGAAQSATQARQAADAARQRLAKHRHPDRHRRPTDNPS